MLTISHVGVSQMYYMMAACPLWAIFSLTKIEVKKFGNQKIFNRAITALITLIFILPALFISFKNCFTNVIRDAKDGLSDSTRGMGRFSQYNYVTPLKYEALIWIRDNTEKDAMLATNVSVVNLLYPDDKFDSISVFTERQMWIECVV